VISRSVGFDVGGTDHLAPALGFLAEEHRRARGRLADRLQVQIGELARGVRILERLGIALAILSASTPGVPGGAATPNQVSDTKPGRVSDSGRTPGSAVTSRSLATASAFSVPLRTCGSASDRFMNIASTSPLSTAG
jgi:hypothetical protein